MNDKLKLTISFEISGVKNGKKLNKIVGSNRQMSAHSIEDLARLWSIGEHITGMCGTRLDYVLDDYKELFGASDTDIQYLMQKYWYKRDITFKELLDEYKHFTKKDVDETLLMFHFVGQLIEHFDKSPIEVKRGLMYVVWKHFVKFDFDDLKKEIESTPQYISEFIDEKLFLPSDVSV
jgi:hypothetical protein